jgi:hypothetical protein
MVHLMSGNARVYVYRVLSFAAMVFSLWMLHLRGRFWRTVVQYPMDYTISSLERSVGFCSVVY